MRFAPTPTQADVEEITVDFEVGMWNGIKHAFPEAEIRTNNNCEGWHRRLNYRTGRENLPMYTLINVLHREASLVNLTLQLVAEHSLHVSSTRRKGSKDHQVNLHKLWGEYEEKKISTKQFLMSCKKMLPF